ncbi:MAG: hypothetical protein ACRDPT_15275 [Streptomycetales bacterium]
MSEEFDLDGLLRGASNYGERHASVLEGAELRRRARVRHHQRVGAAVAASGLVIIGVAVGGASGTLPKIGGVLTGVTGTPSPMPTPSPTPSSSRPSVPPEPVLPEPAGVPTLFPQSPSPVVTPTTTPTPSPTTPPPPPASTPPPVAPSETPPPPPPSAPATPAEPAPEGAGE